MPLPCCAYLDIETTGLSPHDSELTVIGICVERGRRHQVVQLVGDGITDEALWNALEGVGRIYTYNGLRFDLPFIAARIGVNLAETLQHRDLMFDCWRNRLYGGFKSVERKLGISRKTVGIDGFEAVRLWYRYVNDGDEDALSLLLEYNREDVVNLKKLRRKLGV
jgi:uncharacterized protein YprB with RNaseH-like and TPR domain